MFVSNRVCETCTFTLHRVAAAQPQEALDKSGGGGSGGGGVIIINIVMRQLALCMRIVRVYSSLYAQVNWLFVCLCDVELCFFFGQEMHVLRCECIYTRFVFGECVGE